MDSVYGMNAVNDVYCMNAINVMTAKNAVNEVIAVNAVSCIGLHGIAMHCNGWFALDCCDLVFIVINCDG